MKYYLGSPQQLCRGDMPRDMPSHRSLWKYQHKKEEKEICSRCSRYAKVNEIITHFKYSHFVFEIYSDNITSTSSMHLKCYLKEI